MDRRPFVLFGASHWVAMLLSVVATFVIVSYLRKAPPKGSAIVRTGLALMLFAAVLADPPITYLRYIGDGPAMAWKMVNETAWPFYLCDWAAVLCGLALLTKSQRLAELGWCWGLGGTLQGLVYPASLSYDWPNPDYYAFFAEHGGVPVAGMALVFGLGLKPQPGAAWRAWLWLLGYTAVVILVNLLFIHGAGYQTSNYGFVCSSDYSPFAILGPWPHYVLGLLLVMGLLFTFLTWPFCGKRTLAWKSVRK
jgi:hypothetical integral membrane protein (TIGR02206 family)